LYSLGLSLTVPTRTLTFESDPGRQWLLSPGFRYAHGVGKFLWYAMLLAPLEWRPAGLAIEVSPALGVGLRPLSWWTVSLGAAVDVRVATWCNNPDGFEFCKTGRATELDRDIGATR